MSISALDLRVNSIRYCEPAWSCKMQRPHIWGTFIQCRSLIEMHRWNNWIQFFSHSFRTNCRHTWLKEQFLVISFVFLLCISPRYMLCAQRFSTELESTLRGSIKHGWFGGWFPCAFAVGVYCSDWFEECSDIPGCGNHFENQILAESGIEWQFQSYSTTVQVFVCLSSKGVIIRALSFL